MDGNVPSCNYFFITGETKTSRGEADITRKCGLYKPGTAPRARVQPVVLRGSSPKRERRAEERPRARAGRRYDWAQFRALWEEGKTDAEIARAFGANAGTIRKWRHYEGLPPRHRPEIDRKKLRELWEAGMNDPQIAQALGIPRSSAQKARTAMGLPTRSPKMATSRKEKP